MTDALYHTAIFDLARAAHGAGTLAAAGASVTLDNPLCGDRVTIELTLDHGILAGFAQRVRGCTLCEAAASAIGAHAIGATPAALAAAGAAARALIAGTVERAPWPELDAFRPARDHKSRHRCVLLPFEALAKALAEAGPG